MKTKLLCLILMVTRNFLYGLIAQTILLTTVLANGSNAQVKSIKEVQVQLDAGNFDIRSVFNQIERKSQFKFVFPDLLVDGKQNINVNSRQESLFNILLNISKVTNLKFRQVDYLIYVGHGDQEQNIIIGQAHKVTGRITSSEDDEGLPGVNVVIKGSSQGTVTDVEGNYSIEVPSDDAVLVFSAVGYVKEDMPVGNRTVIDLALAPDIKTLNEIVVIGYGNVKKKDLTGSVSKVEVEEVKDIPANSMEGLLQGRAAGLQIINPSQEPGAGSIVRIRGGSSLRGSNSPLVVVDGFPLGDAGDLKQINPADIESIEVLKDASASAIYGSRGANGVIMVTTRKAKTGKTTLNLRQEVTYSEFSSKLNLWRDPALMARLSNEAAINGGFEPQYIGAENDVGIYYPSIAEIENGEWPYTTKWDDIVFRDTPISNNTNLSISSSNETTSFNLSGNYYTDQGMYIEDDYSKINANINVSHKFYDNLKITFSSIINRGYRNDNSGLAYWRNPLLPVFNEDGTYYRYNNNDYYHPLALTENRLNKTKSLDVLSFLDGEWKITPSLKLTSRLNYKYGNSIQDQYDPPIYTLNGQNNNGAGYIRNGQWHTIVSETFFNYNKLFGPHEIGVTAGYSYQDDIYRGSDLGAFDFVNSNLKNENIGSGNPEQNSVNNAFQETALMSGIFRVNYTLNEKYLFTFTSRADGSSKFGANNKWALFPFRSY